MNVNEQIAIQIKEKHEKINSFVLIFDCNIKQCNLIFINLLPPPHPLHVLLAIYFSKGKKKSLNLNFHCEICCFFFWVIIFFNLIAKMTNTNLILHIQLESFLLKRPLLFAFKKIEKWVLKHKNQVFFELHWFGWLELIALIECQLKLESKIVGCRFCCNCNWIFLLWIIFFFQLSFGKNFDPNWSVDQLPLFHIIITTFKLHIGVLFPK